MNTDIQRNLLIINSTDKSSGSSSNFNYNLGDTSLEINSLSLKSASIPHTHTNINANNNTMIVETGAEFLLTSTAKANYLINGNSNDIPLAPGMYSLNTLISALNSNQQFGNFFYDTINSRVVFTNIVAGINAPGIEFTTGGTPEIIGLLGFNLPFTCPAGIGSTVTATNAPTYVKNVITTTLVPAGQYTASELVVAVATAIDPYIAGTIVGTIDALTGRAVFTGATQEWRFNFSPLPPLFGWELAARWFNTSPVMANFAFDLYGTRNLYISSRVLANGYNSLQAEGEKSSILGNVPVCSSYLGIDKWEAKYPIKKNYPQAINVNSIDIKILDDTGNLADLSNSGVVLVFEIWNSVKL